MSPSLRAHGKEATQMGMGDLLGSILQSGMSRSTSSRVRSSLGGAGGLRFGGGQTGGSLGNILNEAGRLVGGNQNLALSGLGALAGAVMGSRRGLGGAIRGGIGGGAVAMIGLMAYRALRNSGSPTVPLGLAEPKTPEERVELERHSELILKAMVDAAKADGRIDESEMSRIIGKIREAGAEAAELDFLKSEMGKPMDTAGLVAAARGKPDLAAELYAASLLAIEVDTDAERDYLAGLADALGLSPEVVRQLHEMVDVRS